MPQRRTLPARYANKRNRTEDIDVKKTLCVVTVFAVAMGFLEAAVVVYLRLHFYPNGFSFPLAVIPDNILLVEVVRELATIVMLAAIGWLAGQGFLLRFSFFSLAFGIWDISYYIFLKITLDWPASLLTDDILFLIPLPWVGPVACACSGVAVPDRRRPRRLSPRVGRQTAHRCAPALGAHRAGRDGDTHLISDECRCGNASTNARAFQLVPVRWRESHLEQARSYRR